jgi:hypothetical protein
MVLRAINFCRSLDQSISRCLTIDVFYIACIKKDNPVRRLLKTVPCLKWIIQVLMAYGDNPSSIVSLLENRNSTCTFSNL